MSNDKLKLENKLNLDAVILKKDYTTLGSLKKVAQKYNVSTAGMTLVFRRLKIEYEYKTKRQPINSQYFSDNNPGALYWAGFLAADGNISDNNRVSLELSTKDLAHLIDFKNDLGMPKRNISRRSRKFKNDNILHFCALGFVNKDVVNDLKRFAIIPRKSLILKFPKILINDKNVNIFCRGFIDGDGSWSIFQGKRKTPQLSLSIYGPKRFLRIFNKVLVKQAELPDRYFNKKIYKNGKAKLFVLQYAGNDVCTKIAQWIYKDIIVNENNRYLDRKFTIAKPFLDSFEDRNQKKQERAELKYNVLELHNLKVYSRQEISEIVNAPLNKIKNIIDDYNKLKSKINSSP